MYSAALKMDRQPATSRLFAVQRGFTLIELMVVIVIIGVITTYVTLSTGGDRRAEQLEREVRRFSALVALASEEAIMRSEVLALRIRDNEYEFMMMRNAKWVPYTDDDMFRVRTLPDGLEMQLELQDNAPKVATSKKDESELPQVYLFSSGEMSPFILSFSSEHTEYRQEIKVNLLGRINIE